MPELHSRYALHADFNLASPTNCTEFHRQHIAGVWVARGMPWSSEVMRQPHGWNPVAQVTSIPSDVVEPITVGRGLPNGGSIQSARTRHRKMSDDRKEIHWCLACGFAGLAETPYDDHGAPSLEICRSCGFLYGFDDHHESSIAEWRHEWIRNGMRWWSSIAPPPEWDPIVQLQCAGTHREEIGEDSAIAKGLRDRIERSKGPAPRRTDLYRAAVVPGSATGHTRHSFGGVLLPEPRGLLISRYDDDPGYYLLYLDDRGDIQTDTYHESLDGAFRQAKFEFSLELSDWEGGS